MSTHRLVEIRPIIKQVAFSYGMTSLQVREAPTRSEAKVALVVALRETGLSAVEVAGICGVDRDHVAKLAPDAPAYDGARAASYCPRCDGLRVIADFANHREKADGLQPYCRDCRRTREREDLAGRVRYHARPAGRPRERLQAFIASEVNEVLADTASRHRTTKSMILERAVAKALACVNCHRALREVGGDDCAACRKVWSMTG